MPKESCCCGCFHITTGASVAGVLQAIVVVMMLSTSAILLQRSQVWRGEYEQYLNEELRRELMSTASPSSTSSTSTSSSSSSTWYSSQSPLDWIESRTWLSPWRDPGLVAFIEIHLTHHVAFYTLWLLFLAMYGMAFKSYRSSLVLPNLIMQVISVAILMILGGLIIAKLVFLAHQYKSFDGTHAEREDLDLQYTSYSILIGCIVIGWVAELIFIWAGIDFYHYVRDMQTVVHPAPGTSSMHAAITTQGYNPQRNQVEKIHATIEAHEPKYADAMA